MIPTETMGSVGRIQDAWMALGVPPAVQANVRNEKGRNGRLAPDPIARAGWVKSATALKEEGPEPSRSLSVPNRILARIQAALALMATGLGTSTAGLGWDYYVHEVAKEVTSVESMFAAPHLLIFGGFAITGLGFLAALVSARSLLPLLARRASRRSAG